MSEPGPIPFRAKPIDRVSRALGTTLLFILVGPPIGSLVYIAAGLLAWTQGVGKFEPSGVLVLLGYIGASYVPGFLPAVVAGFIIGLVHSIVGRIPWWTIPIPSYLAASIYDWRGAIASVRIPSVSISFFLSCLVATIGCVLIARWLEKVWWRPTDATAAPEDTGRET